MRRGHGQTCRCQWVVSRSFIFRGPDGVVVNFSALRVGSAPFIFKRGLVAGSERIRDHSGVHAIKAHPLPGLRFPSIQLTNVI